MYDFHNTKNDRSLKTLQLYTIYTQRNLVADLYQRKISTDPIDTNQSIVIELE